MDRAERIAALSASAYAHRGLHDSAAPENSLAAFRAAIAAGFGIECDIRKSSEGRAVVFHDATLDRMTGVAGETSARSVGELTAIALAGTEQTIPTLRDTLELLNGAVPLMLEIKSDDHRPIDAICRAVRRDLDGYPGLVCVMSFDPRVPRWFANREPDCPRGLVVTEQDSRTLIASIKRRLSVSTAKADFLALDIRDLPSRFASSQAGKGMPLFTWTVNSAAHLETALRCGAVPILESAGVAAWEAGT